MAVPVLTFFNNKGGVGKTSLVYHLAWMYADLGLNVLAVDLDPQANLTSMFLEEDQLETLYNKSSQSANTIFKCVKPLMEVGNLQSPTLQDIAPALHLIPGDLDLAGFEDTLSVEWNSLGSNAPYRPFRILTAFSTIMQKGAKQVQADVILADVGPNLGAINRSALIATQFVVVPLGADLFSLQGLRNLGPTLQNWRRQWKQHKERRDPLQDFDFLLPSGSMKPIGYVVQQHGVRLDRPVQAYDKWINRMPMEYAKSLLGQENPPYPLSPDEDKNVIATIKHYRSLVPMAQEARKPIFNLTTADGARGGHATAAKDAYYDFEKLALKIRGNMRAS